MTYHGLLREVLDLLDGTRSALLEGDTVQLIQPVSMTMPLGFRWLKDMIKRWISFLSISFIMDEVEDIPSCGGGWCTRGRRPGRSRTWRASFPCWSTFLIFLVGGDVYRGGERETTG